MQYTLIRLVLIANLFVLGCGHRNRTPQRQSNNPAQLDRDVSQDGPAQPAHEPAVTLETPGPAQVKSFVLEPGSGYTYTKQEVEIWRQRSQRGPYREGNDAQANSPGDYARIKANADAFRKNPSADRWNGGYQGKGCVPKGTTKDVMAYEPHPKGDLLKDAAFVYLLSDDAALGRLVVDELLNYSRLALIDFSNRERWCLGDASVRDVNPGFFTAAWLSKMVFAYDYVRALVSESERTAIETWLQNAGTYFQLVNDEVTNDLYADRARGVLKDPTRWAAPGKKTHDGGYDIPALASHYNARRSFIARTVGQIGVLVGHPELKRSASLYYQEWIKYTVFPDGTPAEFYRGSAQNRETGYHYSLVDAVVMIDLADAFARGGDSSLYDFTTSDGIGMTKGGRKDLHLLLNRMNRMLDGSTKRYLPGFANQAAYLLNGIDADGRQFIYDIWFSTANLYYRDPYIRSVYLRQAPGTLPYPAEPANTGAYHTWSGTHGELPGTLFMRSQLEHIVWPYFSPALPVGAEHTEVVVTAHGTGAGDVYPLMRVYANEALLGQVYVKADTEPYRFMVQQPTAAISQVMVQFVNDEPHGNASRSLTVDSVKLGGEGTSIVPGANTATYIEGDRSSTQVVPGQPQMSKRGYLIIKTP